MSGPACKQLHAVTKSNIHPHPTSGGHLLLPRCPSQPLQAVDITSNFPTSILLPHAAGATNGQPQSSTVSSNLNLPVCRLCRSKQQQIHTPARPKASANHKARKLHLVPRDEKPMLRCAELCSAQHTRSSGTQTRQQPGAVLSPAQAAWQQQGSTVADTALSQRDGCVDAHMYAGGQTVAPCYALHCLRHSISSKQGSKEPLSTHFPLAHPHTTHLLNMQHKHASRNQHAQTGATALHETQALRRAAGVSPHSR